MKSKISIIGLGLIGGSLAKALNERLGITDITAIDENTSSLTEAVEEGIITRGFTTPNLYVWNSDIIFICTPVKYTTEYIKALAGRVKPDCIITDVGSTKEKVIEFINSLESPPCFIGGHPMSGTEKTGYRESFSHLFENAYYIITPSKSSTEASLNIMHDLIQRIGGIPILIEAREHDKIVGGISHVPHIIASALVNLVREMDSADGRYQVLAAGGFKDITRIASSNPQLWESIISSNSKQIISIMDNFIDMLYNINKDILTENSKKVTAFFESARDYRNLIPSGKAGLIKPLFNLVVDVVDKPGIIGEIATHLGNSNINIKNINVSNSREFEQGCLIITLPDQKSLDSAFEILKAKGYKVYSESSNLSLSL